MQIRHRINTQEDYRRARNLRNDASPFERKLWDGIRKMMPLRNIKFRRQQPIHPYIADFACMKARLLVELDGTSHDTRISYDRQRDADLHSRGFHILRFRNEDVSENLEAVIIAIFDEAECLIRDRETQPSPAANPLPNPPHKGEGTPPFFA